MKKSKYHIVRSWILLICFVAGQYMIYAHQHYVTKFANKSHTASKNTQQQTVKEKCYLCDAMHHNIMVNATFVYYNSVSTADHFFKDIAYKFTSIQLILSSGRAPPAQTI